MQISFGSIVEEQKGRFTGYKVSGTVTDSGKPWSTFIFGNHKDASMLKGLSGGETVEVKMVKKGNFWNAESFTVAGGASTTPSSGTEKPKYSGKSTGAPAGAFRDPAEIIRGEALANATKFVSMLLNDPENRVFKKTSKEDLIVDKTLEYAFLFEEFITGKLKKTADASSSSADLMGMDDAELPD